MKPVATEPKQGKHDALIRLKDLCWTETGPYRRPFRPVRGWTASRVLLIGNNPATPLREEFADFDDYWRCLTEQPDRFLLTQMAARQGRRSKTSTRLQELEAQLGDVQALACNAAAYPIAHGGRVPAHEWRVGAQIVKVLLEVCSPAAVFAHGSRARDLLLQLFGTAPAPLTPPADQMVWVKGVRLLCAPHLSGAGLPPGSSFDVASALPAFAAELRASAQGGIGDHSHATTD
jgi:hypothetical protein